MLHDAQDITIRNNVVRAFRTVNTGGGSNGNLTFVNNLFINDLSSNPDLSPAGIGLENITNCVIKNNIFYDIIDDQISIHGGSGIDIDYNCFYRSDGVIPISDGAPNAHDLWGINPKFVNVLENDFRLQSDSPCIDAGTSLSEVTNDYEGNSRPQGAGYDIGAYECVKFNLTIETSTSGTTNPSPGVYSHPEGTDVQVEATPDSGYRFTNWSGDASGTTNPITITMDSDKSITANFRTIFDPVDETAPGDETAKKGGCFIVTAAYGSPLHPYINILQDFRDKYLMPIKLGREIVNFYYKYSPFVADLIAKHTALKFAVRINLLPLVIFSYSMVQFGPIISGIILVSIFVLQVFLILFLRRKIIKKSKKVL